MTTRLFWIHSPLSFRAKASSTVAGVMRGLWAVAMIGRVRRYLVL